MDDEPLMRGLLHNALEGKGYQVESCEDGKSAIEKLANHAYDLVLTDHAMPRMTGIELIHSLRSGGGRTPVILMTSYTLAELLNPGQDLKGVEFLRKPFGLTELHTAVRSAMRTSRG